MPDQITAYKLTYDCKDGLKEFITLDVTERDFKVLEVLQDYTDVTLSYSKYQTTREAFMQELKRITGCI